MGYIPMWAKKLPKTSLDKIAKFDVAKAKLPNGIKASSKTPPTLPKLPDDYNTYVNPKSINFETFKGYLPKLPKT